MEAHALHAKSLVTLLNYVELTTKGQSTFKINAANYEILSLFWSKLRITFCILSFDGDESAHWDENDEVVQKKKKKEAIFSRLNQGCIHVRFG